MHASFRHARIAVLAATMSIGATTGTAVAQTAAQTGTETGTETGTQTGTGHSLPGRSSGPSASAAARQAWQSAWVKGHESSARLIAGAMPGTAGGASQLHAGVELRLSEGWKTYWRHPGDDGGLPPTFDWSASRNLKAARVVYPAPKRLKSKTGMSIGYEGGVIFPVLLEPIDRSRPVELALRLEYGICREICVPAEAIVNLSVAPTLAIMPAVLTASVADVPQPADKSGGAPKLAKATAALTGPQPALDFDIFPGEAADRADLFVEAPEGTYLPMARKVGALKAGVQRFRIDLKGVEGAAQLAGKPLRLTITGLRGGSEATWTVR